MKFISDLHIHSKYSRATSKDMDLEHLNKWAQIKGIQVMGTGDLTHPQWFKELKQNLAPAEDGLFILKKQSTKLKNDPGIFLSKDRSRPTRFLLSGEISCIYSKKGKTHRVHLLVYAPYFEAVEKINARLNILGNVKSDGRPILGLDAKELAKIIFALCAECVIVPAHIWTPWFSVFGSMSGFDSLTDCFEEYAKYIFAIETGLSSDPSMNWRLSALDNISFISNSDSHGLTRIGREANVFNTELSYRGIFRAIQQKKPENFLETIEFFPEEGKYHYDGHLKCKVRMSPDETIKNNGKCPKCGRQVTVGVMSRVSVLADRQEGDSPKNTIPFRRAMPLDEIIAAGVGLISVGAKAVKKEYKNLVENIGCELDILLEIPLGDLAKSTLPEIAEGIKRMRNGEITVEPGYDGEYGHIKIFKKGEREKVSSQNRLI
ncbi:MAG: DNA helicase UvrD [Candidatus Portnoybacteria bacterium CG10_big_fil_rev_8_21_14_0_10_36_7]|uniref:DNA helicase UvrD n=1 Tax=Candidatus Portnoybacteria bacterium CG10_big_fil_rev_8_21_14_0_10_36_7 TaxID=1974812 RepID=A0A2M8KD76_9BACT|nr:MAG: DNA helicase UvrD [Candidatus Portnoybacteria bacterium CG10_big_fil_rev_8_21_14_0_10_36_7]